MNEAEARRSGQSNEEIIAALYEEMRPARLGYVYHLTGSARDAEDLVQIAFRQLFEQLGRVRRLRTCAAGFTGPPIGRAKSLPKHIPKSPGLRCKNHEA